MKQNWWRTYLIIWSGQFVSMLSSVAVQFAVIIWLSLEYQSTQVLAYAGIAGLLPHALIGSFVGVFIDRWNRKLVMIFADAFIAVCTLLMTFIMKSGEIHLLMIYILLACRSVGTAFHAPSLQAITPLIVPKHQLLRVAGINQVVQSVSNIAGPVVGTLAIVALPIHQVLYLDILGALVAITVLFFISIPHIITTHTTRPSLKSMLGDLKVGMQAIYQNKGLGYLFLMVMISNIFFAPIIVMYPMLITQHYGGGKWEMGITETFFGIGMLIGGGILGFLRANTSKVALVNWMDIVVGLCFICAGIFPSHWFWGFIIMMAIGGITASIFMAAFNTILQQIVAPNKLGRVFSIYLSFGNIPSIIGMLCTGFIAQHIGVDLATIVAGVLTMIIGAVSFAIPSLMNVEKQA